MDYFSRFLEILEMKSTTGEQVVHKLKTVFARFGIPEVLVSDNGPQFACSTMQEFALEFDFRHITTSPHFPQANGEAEAGVAIAKHIITQPDPFRALLNYRATPTIATGFSPAELLMGRRIRTTLPVLMNNLDPGWPDLNNVRDNDRKAKRAYTDQYNKRHGVRELPALQPGDQVLTKLDKHKRWEPATIVSNADTPRSYIIQTEGQGMVRRNRKHLQGVLQQPVNTGRPTQCGDIYDPVVSEPTYVSSDIPGTTPSTSAVTSTMTLPKRDLRPRQNLKAAEKFGEWTK